MLSQRHSSCLRLGRHERREELPALVLRRALEGRKEVAVCILGLSFHESGPSDARDDHLLLDGAQAELLVPAV